jgi:hypothetical protein
MDVAGTHVALDQVVVRGVGGVLQLPMAMVLPRLICAVADVPDDVVVEPDASSG